MQQLLRVNRTRRRTCWLILSWPVGLDGLTQLASPRFEEKEALSARQMEDGKLLDHPQLGGDLRPAKMADWTSMSRV